MSITGNAKAINGIAVPYCIPVDQNGVVIRDYVNDVAFGLVPGVRRIAALGHNADIDAAEDIWSGGGFYPWLTASASLEIVSDNAADASAGTGARTVTINGLNAAWAEISQTVTLNGMTPVAIPTALYRVQSAFIMTAGSGQVNAGTVNIRDAGAGTVRAVLPAGYGTTRQSQFTVPAGYTLSIHSILVCINRPTSTRDATVATFVQLSTGAYRMPLEFSVDGNPYRHDGTPGIVLPEKTDFGLRCNYVSTANTDMTGAWLGIMRLNTLE